MNITFSKLTLLCRQSLEEFSLDSSLVLITGPISVGKSSALTLIDYCLGGSHNNDWSPIVRNEVRFVRLDARMGQNTVVLERPMHGTSVDITWEPSEGAPGFAKVPIVPGSEEILPNVYGLSDMLFYLCGIDHVMVPKRASDPESGLIRLSFRDLMWFCYLPQDRLDSNFFHLYDPNRRPKARWAMRFFTGFYSDRIVSLEQRVDSLRLERAGIESAATQLHQGLVEISDGSSFEELMKRRIALEKDEVTASANLRDVTERYRAATHAADGLRERLRALYREIVDREKSVDSQRDRIHEMTSLRAEYIMLKLRAERSRVALTIIGEASFRHCPKCARPVEESNATGSCALCKAKDDEKSDESFDADALSAAAEDLSQRILELDESINAHRESLVQQQRILDQLIRNKGELDGELQSTLAEYDSAYVSRLREGERRLSAARAMLETTNSLLKLHRNLERYLARAGALTKELSDVRKAIADELRSMAHAQEMVTQIEGEFLKVLRRVGVPGVNAGDHIRLSPQDWTPWVTNDFSPEDEFDYRSASSGGKKVLFVVCYALALHAVAERNGLPLPTFLMIDTPTKNVERDINKEIVRNVQKVIFEMASDELRKTQLIVVNGTFESFAFETEPTRIALDYDTGLISYYHETHPTLNG
jgi:hypothetical protein